MPIRVLRLLEYTYASVEDMERDMSNWGIPANGVKRIHVNGKLSIKSAVLPLEVMDPEVTNESLLPVGAFVLKGTQTGRIPREVSEEFIQKDRND